MEYPPLLLLNYYASPRLGLGIDRYDPVYDTSRTYDHSDRSHSGSKYAGQSGDHSMVAREPIDSQQWVTLSGIEQYTSDQSGSRSHLIIPAVSTHAKSHHS